MSEQDWADRAAEKVLQMCYSNAAMWSGTNVAAISDIIRSSAPDARLRDASVEKVIDKAWQMLVKMSHPTGMLDGHPVDPEDCYICDIKRQDVACAIFTALRAALTSHEPKVCDKCDGTGRTVDQNWSKLDGNGRPEVSPTNCPTCHGTGVIKVKEL